MVMNARKQQRLANVDGYHDRQHERSDAYPYHNDQSPGKYKKMLYNDHRSSPNNCTFYSAESPSDSNSYSSPRTFNSSYSEQRRNRHSRQRGSSSSPSEHPALSRMSSSEANLNSTNHGNNGHYTHQQQNLSSQAERAVADDGFIVLRLHSCGDWSEHVSSSGKKYFYHCKTEVSQWEQPKDWDDRLAVFRSEHRCKKPDSRTTPVKAATTVERQHSNSYYQQHGRTAANENRRSVSMDTHISEHSNDNAAAASLSSIANLSSQGSHTDQHTDRNNHDVILSTTGGGSGSSNNVSSVYTGSMLNPHVITSSHQQHQHSSLSTATLPPLLLHPASASASSTSTFSCTTTSGPMCNRNNLVAASTASTINNAESHLTNITPQEALKTVQSLQEALLQKVSRAPTSSIVSSSSSAALTSVMSSAGNIPIVQAEVSYSPSNVALYHDDNNSRMKDDSSPPCSDHSQHSTIPRLTDSPPSAGGSGSLQAFSASFSALSKQPVSVTITPSLANYYDEQKISHMQNWPGSPLEKQSDKLASDAFNIGSHEAADTTAGLKYARSLVRVAEIQATLQEQRMMFLEQSIQELEQLKSQNTFMS